MKQGGGGIPVACLLSDAEFGERQASLLAQFKPAVIATEELPDGFAFRVPGDRKWIAAVAEWIAAERECCRFLRFDFTAQPNLGLLIVRVTGPAGAKDIVRTIFGGLG